MASYLVQYREGRLRNVTVRTRTHTLTREMGAVVLNLSLASRWLHLTANRKAKNVR